jgi:hypothetical protein
MAIEALRKYVELGNAENFGPIAPNSHFYEDGVQTKYLVPGHFYSFLHMKPMGNDQLPSLDDWTTGTSKAKPYFDNYPIFLALDQFGQSGLGLNVKLLPQLVRRSIIRSYLKLVMPVLEKMTDDTGNFLEFEERIRPPMINPFGSITLNFIKQALFSQLPEIKFSFLVDKYNRADMRYLTLVDWPNVPKIGEINYSNDPTIVSRSAISDYLKNV